MSHRVNIRFLEDVDSNLSVWSSIESLKLRIKEHYQNRRISTGTGTDY
jgi:hypothetical protein